MRIDTYTILILEKNETLLEVLDVVLIGRYRCIYVGTLEKAKELFEDKSHQLNLVITEDSLPDGTGLDLVLLCNQAQIPCIGISENTSMKNRFLESGATDFLVKPVDYDKLLKVVWGMVEQTKF